VRRHSRLKGREGLFWRPFDPQEKSRYMLAAERYERTTRAKGQRSGKLGSVAIEVLRELLRLVDHKTGRLDPSISTLCDRIRRSRDAVVRALANLRAAGFLDWIRRYEPTENEGRGPQVQQASNAYRLTLPALAMRLLGRLAKPAPIPDDHQQRRDDHKAEAAAMIDGLPLWEQPAHLVEDSDLAEILSRIARGVVERESAKQTESPRRI
jgi:DNA-binding transcriptional MocR family regulator